MFTIKLSKHVLNIENYGDILRNAFKASIDEYGGNFREKIDVLDESELIIRSSNNEGSVVIIGDKVGVLSDDDLDVFTDSLYELSQDYPEFLAYDVSIDISYEERGQEEQYFEFRRGKFNTGYYQTPTRSTHGHFNSHDLSYLLKDNPGISAEQLVELSRGLSKAPEQSINDYIEEILDKAEMKSRSVKEEVHDSSMPQM